jgi:Tol biopolymer transport system component/predicted Ser/Thr protein kinase
MIGTTIDRYQIVEQLGQGGMGVVYKARDTLLERFVALKVLPPDKTTDPERRQRFLQEAKSASALNHPGIVAVHDVITVDGQDVLVMELVEGETLEERLAQRRMPLSEALGLSIAIAEALARAHSAGIVHRDLKPSNVMVTADGVKVLDFGLAKLTEAPFTHPEGPTMAQDESSLTQQRAVLGTVGWMSPEQASGEPVDSRSDVFAFGVLLYEMLTGTHPFRRGTVLETIAAIREDEPARLTETVPALPPEVERAVLRCLRKNPERRWQSLSDLKVVLEDLKEDTESGRTMVPGQPARRRAVSPWLVAGVAAVVVVALAVVVPLLRREPAGVRPLELHRLTYDAGASLGPTISPDGNLVAFSSDRAGRGDFDIWVRHINQPEPTRLTDHPADDWHPSFSPDGSRLIFRSQRDGGGIYIVNALGGGLRKVAGPGLFPRFTPDGESFVYGEDTAWSPGFILRMIRAPVHGGPAEPFIPGWGVLAPPNSTGPVFSPDGRLVIFHGAQLDDPVEYDWWVAPVDGGEPWSSGARTAVDRIGFVQFPTCWLPGRLLLVAGTTIEGMNLYQARISDDGHVTGPVEPLTAGPGMSWVPKVSRDGRIALSRFYWIIHLWEVGLDPASGRPVGDPRPITDDASPKFSFSLTRDGDRLAYSTYAGSRDSPRNEIHLLDRTTGSEAVPLTYPMAILSLHPRLNGDGSRLSWRTRSEGGSVSWVAPTDDPAGRELCRGCQVVDFFTDGASVLAASGNRLVRRVIDGGVENPVLELGDMRIVDADLSRDDRWLAIQVGNPDRTVSGYLVPVEDPPAARDRWIRIDEHGVWIGAPRWSADGATIYFISERDDFLCVWGQPLDPSTKVPVGDPFAAAHAHTTKMKMLPFAKHMWNLEVGADRLVFNAGELTGDVYTAMLDREE